MHTRRFNFHHRIHMKKLTNLHYNKHHASNCYLWIRNLYCFGTCENIHNFYSEKDVLKIESPGDSTFPC